MSLWDACKQNLDKLMHLKTLKLIKKLSANTSDRLTFFECQEKWKILWAKILLRPERKLCGSQTIQPDLWNLFFSSFNWFYGKFNGWNWSFWFNGSQNSNLTEKSGKTGIRTHRLINTDILSELKFTYPPQISAPPSNIRLKYRENKESLNSAFSQILFISRQQLSTKKTFLVKA
jgi:hypothetical protein